MFVMVVVVILFALCACFTKKNKIVRIRRPGVDAYIVTNVPSNLLMTFDRLVPDRSKHPSHYPDTVRPLGYQHGWVVPPDETYLHHGVIVSTPRLESADKLALWASRTLRMGQLTPTEIRVKAHIHYSNGVWMHTDRRPGREILMLIYLTDLRVTDGGMLHLFETNETTWPTRIVTAYPRNEKIKFERSDRIQTAYVGGAWHERQRIFSVCKRIVPTRGLAVILDCTHEHNVHAVECMQSTRPRHVVEVWLQRSMIE